MQEILNSLLNENYFTALVLFIFILILLLVFLVFHYKKILKTQNDLLKEKDEKIKSLRKYSYEMELQKVEREHEIEKEILNLNHNIKELKQKEKEGLKNQVVTMLEKYEKKRAQLLNHIDLKL